MVTPMPNLNKAFEKFQSEIAKLRTPRLGFYTIDGDDVSDIRTTLEDMAGKLAELTEMCLEEVARQTGASGVIDAKNDADAIVDGFRDWAGATLHSVEDALRNNELPRRTDREEHGTYRTHLGRVA